MRDGLDHERELVVVGGDLAEGGGVGGVGGESEHFGVQRVFYRYADVVDGRGWVAVVVGVDTDGVGEFEGWEGRNMRDDEVWDVWEEELVGAEYLSSLLFSGLQKGYVGSSVLRWETYGS